MKKTLTLVLALLLAVVAAGLFVGCGGGSDNGDEDKTSDFIGTWILTNVSDGSQEKVVIKADGRFDYYQSVSGGSASISGPYTISGDTLSGTFKNASGSMTGTVSATLTSSKSLTWTSTESNGKVWNFTGAKQ